jgi:hypothetical protein
MHRTFIRNLQKFRPLFLGQLSAHVNVSLNLIEHSFFRFAIGAILGVNS